MSCGLMRALAQFIANTSFFNVCVSNQNYRNCTKTSFSSVNEIQWDYLCYYL